MFYNVEFGFIIFGMMFTLSSALVDGTCDPQTNLCDANANEVCTNSKCVCKPGFNGASGQACSDIDECASNPCKNSGVCTNQVNAFACTCAAGWTGTTCETDIDDCDPGPCKNGGSCADGANAFTCTCAAGWTGTTCETDIDECAANPCKNGGSCANGANKYTCTCVAGWAGTTCETAFDCSTGGTCQNGGTCGVAPATTCSCVTGWTGNDCGKDIDECKQNPCQHGGTCADQVNAYTCKCVAGWKGKNCETATLGIDCSGNKLCKTANNEVCGLDDNKCACKPGFKADSGTCKDIDECKQNPCQHGGTCADQVNAYTCKCVAGWKGNNCETATLGIDCSGNKLCETANNEVCGLDDNKCACKPGFKADSGTCKATLGIDCSGNKPCEAANNEVCGADDNKCACKPGFQVDSGTCKAPDNSSGKTATAAVTLMMAVLTNIIIQMF